MKQKLLLSRFAALLLAVMVGLLPAFAAAASPQLGTSNVMFSGVITTVPAADGEPWVIGGQTVAVNDATRIRLTTDMPAAAGMWAQVHAVRQGDDTLLASQIAVLPPEVRIKGPISDRPEDGIGAWTVAGQTIQVTAETLISDRGGPVTVGSWAEVFAIEDPAGVLTAVRIRGVESAENVEFYGAIQAFSAESWTLSSIVLPVSDATLIISEPQVGLLAHASATLQADGSLVTQVLKVDWQEPGRARQPVMFNGTVETLPTDGLVGDWTVSGRVVQVTDATNIIQIKGLVEVGANVHVMGWQEGNAVVATQITVLGSPMGGGRPFQVIGTIDAMPASGLIGTWVIGGEALEVTQQTRIRNAENAHVGGRAEAGGLQMQNGTRLTAWLRIQDQSGPGPQPSVTVTPHPSRTPSVTPRATRTPGRP